ncbi:apolipoprotein N-acyltransferase [Flavitalea flava]
MHFEKLKIPAAILFSGLCWYLSTGLSGTFWWLVWIAPAPILYISYQVSGRKTFIIAFLAFFLGRLVWLPYLVTVLPLLPVIVFTLFLPLVFALLVIWSRKIVLMSKTWIGVLAFPVLWSSFEFIIFLFSRDGTFGSLAYTQCNFLPLIQIASITGLLGISFLVTLFPSVIALALNFKRQSKNIAYLVWPSVSAIALVILFGIIRLNDSSGSHEISKEITVGMVSLDEKSHYGKVDLTSNKMAPVVNLYAQEVDRLLKAGTQLVLLPEKVITVTDSTFPFFSRLFAEMAGRYQGTIIIGYTLIKKGNKENRSIVFSPEGKISADYSKVKLFEGEVLEGFTPGKETGIFTIDRAKAGIPICKDLDFQQYIRRYGNDNVSILFVSAWDFDKDAWLHSRMAIMRGVENGFSMVRIPRQGQLTISDEYGRVTFEASSIGGKKTILLGKVKPALHNTLYSRWGDWFGYTILLAALYCLFLLFKKKSTRPLPQFTKKTHSPSIPSTVL